MVLTPTEGGTRLALHLSYIRSLGVVGAALQKAFPTNESWEAFRNSDEFISEINHLAEVFDNIRRDALAAATDEDFERVITIQYDLAVDSVVEFAMRYGIPVEDLVQVLIQ